MKKTNLRSANILAVITQIKDGLLWPHPKALVIEQWDWLEFPISMQKMRAAAFQSPWRICECQQFTSGIHHVSIQNSCGAYPILPAATLELNETPPKPLLISKEFKIVALRECPLPESLHMCDTPERAAEYWRLNIATCPYFNQECECFAVLIMNTRRRVKGHQLLTIGTLDTILVHPREVFRGAVIAAAAAILIMHNHPSGDPTPSEADIKVTRDLIRAGQLMKIDVLDHVIIGNPNHCSLRELGYFL